MGWVTLGWLRLGQAADMGRLAVQRQYMGCELGDAQFSPTLYSVAYIPSADTDARSKLIKPILHVS